MEKETTWVQKIENFFKGVERFFSNFNFIARISKAAAVGMAAFNDQLLNRNANELKAYLDARKSTITEQSEIDG